MTRPEIEDAYFTAKAEMRIYDAENSTSYEEEFENLYRNPPKSVELMSDEELIEETRLAVESVEGDEEYKNENGII